MFPHVTVPFLLGILFFTSCCLVQNAMFTWSSRSRNSGDWNYHRRAAWASNGIYFITNALVTLYIVKYNNPLAMVLQGALYTIAASEGSVFMMRKLIKAEAGKRKVGSQLTEEELKAVKALVASQKVAAGFVNKV